VEVKKRAVLIDRDGWNLQRCLEGVSKGSAIYYVRYYVDEAGTRRQRNSLRKNMPLFGHSGSPHKKYFSVWRYLRISFSNGSALP